MHTTPRHPLLLVGAGIREDHAHNLLQIAAARPLILVDQAAPDWARPYLVGEITTDVTVEAGVEATVRQLSGHQAVRGVTTYLPERTAQSARLAHALQLPGNPPASMVSLQDSSWALRMMRGQGVPTISPYMAGHEDSATDVARTLDGPATATNAAGGEPMRTDSEGEARTAYRSIRARDPGDPSAAAVRADEFGLDGEDIGVEDAVVAPDDIRVIAMTRQDTDPCTASSPLGYSVDAHPLRPANDILLRGMRGDVSVFKRSGPTIGTAAILAVLFSLSACTGENAEDGDARAMREALQQLHDAGSFRMAGELHTAEGTSSFDAMLDGRGNCQGMIGRAKSLLVGERVWTHWDDSALHEAVRTLHGGPLDQVDPAAPEADDREWTATRLLQDAFMVTDLPGESSSAEGIAPVCKTGQLLAGAGRAGGDVTAGPAATYDGERLRPLTRVTGPVTVRVLIQENGNHTIRRAEYIIDGATHLTARLSELGKTVSVKPPTDTQTVAASDVLKLIG
ncbi:hypothetical protein ACFY93_09755 [Streptomyces sp. NPDC008313]|uniref:hypothetical protein n=1 Tax=Streptomyces sp. NPDC008313 TaxID=3364826 RepID=UPI0036DFBADD